MGVNLSAIPGLSEFQRTHIGTSVTGLSGILPYKQNGPAWVLTPRQTPKIALPAHISSATS